MMTEGHGGELLVSESDWKSVPSGWSRSSKTTKTEAVGPGWETRERGTIAQRGGEGRREWNGRESLCGALSQGGLYLDIIVQGL